MIAQTGNDAHNQKGGPTATLRMSDHSIPGDEPARLPIQALLVRTGKLSLEQLAEAIRENVQTGRPIEDIVVSRGWVPAELVAELRPLAAPSPAAAPPAPPAPAPAPVPVAAPAPLALPEQPAIVAPYAPPPPAVAAQPIAPPPAAAPPPPAQPTPVAGPAPSVADMFGVFLHMENGEKLRAARHDSKADADRQAKELVDLLMRPEPGVWPMFGRRLVRPESVTSVHVARLND